MYSALWLYFQIFCFNQFNLYHPFQILNSNLANFTDNKPYDGHVNNIIENSIKYSIGAQGLPANVNTYGLIVTLVSGKTGTTVQNAKQLYFPYSDITGYYIRSCVDGNWYPWYRINGVAI